jgi:hypothetical protein
MMRNTGKLAVRLAGSGALAILLATSAFAAARPVNATTNGVYLVADRGEYEGRISAMWREGDGYRLRLEGRSDSFLVPFERLPRGRNLSVGLTIRLVGDYRDGLIVVNDVGWPEGYNGYNGEQGYNGGYNGGYGNNGYRNDNRGFLRGYVERIDYRHHNVWVRDDVSGRTVMVDMRDANRDGNFYFGELRRGDHLAMSGVWGRGGIFDAYQVNDNRY